MYIDIYIYNVFLFFFPKGFGPIWPKTFSTGAFWFLKVEGQPGSIAFNARDLSQTHERPVVQQSRVPFGTCFYLHFPRLHGGTGTHPRHAQDGSQQEPIPIWPLPCTATALSRARRFVASMQRAADCMCLKVCMLQFFLNFGSQRWWFFIRKWCDEVRQSFRFLHMYCSIFQFQICTGLVGSQPHSVKIMSWQSSFQWSVKDMKVLLKQ